ncbi:MAG: class II aldolase/adducin family protein, partial [Gammaproteobacteria bacterium]
YDEITASNLLKVDLEGNVINGDGTERVNLAGYVIHSAIHGAREDVVCALHTHGPAVTAVSCLQEGFMFINQDSMQFAGQVAYHDFEGIAINEEERGRLVADLGNQSTLILRNHGALTVGRSVGEAFVMMYLLEHACKIQLSVMASGAKIRDLENGRLDSIATDVPEQQMAITPDGIGKLPFEALMRELDITDPDYAN